jgi:L-2,4-diaminobutyrate decarboxylase
METRLDDLYNPKKFEEFGFELIELISSFLDDSHKDTIKVNNWKEPEDQLEYWRNYNIEGDSPKQLFKDILENSINVQHPKYIGHQISPTAPLSALSGLLSAILNNGMAVYEMGAAATAIEKLVIELIAKKIGYNTEADGFITSGGTLANLTALLSARQSMNRAGIANDKMAIIVSAEAHYCIEKSVRVMGFDGEQVIKVPVGDQFNMQTGLLEECYAKAISQGKKIVAVVGSAPSTSTGMYDDLEKIAAFCKSKKVWFHVDAAHGGGAIFSQKYKHLLQGVEAADSVVIDGHKMLLSPSIMTFLVFKDEQDSYETFKQKAQYLWKQDQEEEWYNLAKRTFECTKSMMSIQFYTILKFYGEEIFDQFVTKLFDLGKNFAEKVKLDKDFELFLDPQSNIVCFRYKPAGYDNSQLNEINNEIRENLLRDGEFYIVQTNLNGSVYLRTTFMNPKTTEKIMDELLFKIKNSAKNILAEN